MKKMNMKNTHKAIVIAIDLKPHPNADKLSICEVGPSQVVLNTESWQGVEKAVYIPPQNIVDTTREEFAFLKREGENTAVVKPVKLRGVYSYGLCVPCPEGYNVGDDLTDYFGIQHYEPEEKYVNGEFENGGSMGSVFKYDIDSPYKELEEWKECESVVISEKIHGQNMRIYYDGEQLHVGGRNKWFKKCNNIYWRAVELYPQIEKFCVDNPNHILYGEQYGHTTLKYGKTKSNVGFAAFDILMPNMEYLDSALFEISCKKWWIPTVNRLYNGPYKSLEFVKSYSVGPTTYNDDHIREGCVIKPTREKKYMSGSRKITKLINPEYKG